MASDHRSSISSLRSAISRNSIGSHTPTSPQMVERRPLNPLAQPSPGFTTLSPPPGMGRGSLPPPMTPKRKPVERQKSPLSAEAFSSPASVMPGAFPVDTPASEQPHDDSPAPGSRSSKRLSSMSKLLPFKTLRKSYDASSQNSSDAPDYRPKTPAGESVMSNSKPSLRTRVSGPFWRRKSSLGMNPTPGDFESEEKPLTPENTAIGTPSPHTNGYYDAIPEDSRPTTPTLGDGTPTMKKRKSGTFWRRTSSMTLTQTMNAEKQGWRKTSEGNYPNGNGGRTRRSGDLVGGSAGQGMERETLGIEKMTSIPPQTQYQQHQQHQQQQPQERTFSDRKPLPPPPRSASPPPQLPEFVGGGGGLGLDDDWLKGF